MNSDERLSSINKFKDGESGRKGWAGFAGCGAVAVSENGLLLAAADGGGTVVVFRKYPGWEVPPEHDGTETEEAPSAPGGMAFSPTSSYAGSVAAGSFSPDNSGYQEVARLRHSHRVRSLTWATEPGWPVLGAGSADGRVRLWRPMGEGQVEVNVSGLRLQNVKPGKEDIYAVVSVGRKIRIGAEVVMDWTVNFPREQDSVFELMNSRQVINVVLYVRPKQKKPAGLERRDSLDSDANKKEEGGGFSRAASLDTGGGESGEGAMAKLIKKKEVLVGKGSAPRMFDRVTMAEDYTKVAATGLDLREDCYGVFSWWQKLSSALSATSSSPSNTPRLSSLFLTDLYLSYRLIADRDHCRNSQGWNGVYSRLGLVAFKSERR